MNQITDYFELSVGNYDRIFKDISFHWPGIISLLYLAGFFYYGKVGTLKPFSRSFTLGYNLLITLFSLVISLGALYSAMRTGIRKGSYSFLVCEPIDHKFKEKDDLLFWSFIYFISKIIELVDTFMRMGRGANVIFLHVFHHAIMVLTGWYLFTLDWTMSWYVSFLNSLVHVVMYFYYFWAVYTKTKPKWGIYVTYFQIVQFLSGLVYFWILLVYTMIYGNKACNNTGFMWFWMLSLNIIFLLQFINFFKAKYGKKKKEGQGKDKKKE